MTISINQKIRNANWVGFPTERLKVDPSETVGISTTCLLFFSDLKPFVGIYWKRICRFTYYYLAETLVVHRQFCRVLGPNTCKFYTDI